MAIVGRRWCNQLPIAPNIEYKRSREPVPKHRTFRYPWERRVLVRAKRDIRGTYECLNMTRSYTPH